jgi:hypothetical protein
MAIGLEDSPIPQIPTYWISNFEQENAGWIDNTQTSNGLHVLQKDILGVGAGMKEALVVTTAPSFR